MTSINTIERKIKFGEILKLAGKIFLPDDFYNLTENSICIFDYTFEKGYIRLGRKIFLGWMVSKADFYKTLSAEKDLKEWLCKYYLLKRRNRIFENDLSSLYYYFEIPINTSEPKMINDLLRIFKEKRFSYNFFQAIKNKTN